MLTNYLFLFFSLKELLSFPVNSCKYKFSDKNSLQ